MARGRGVCRSANPHTSEAGPSASAEAPSTSEGELAARLASCWFIGWDEADRELRPLPHDDELESLR